MNSPKVDIEDDLSDNDSDGGQFTDQCHSKPQRKGQRHRQKIHDSNRSSVSPSSNPDYQHQQQQRQQQQQPSHASLSPRSREYLRLRVNARERQRMHDMNVALDALRRAMPYAQGPAVKKLSKMNTLLLARNYILLLTRTLDELRRLLVAANASPTSPATSASEFTGVGGAATQSSRPTTAGRPPGSSLAIDPARLEAALRGLIDGRGIYAEQQRYAEELVRREQQLEQEQRMLSASGLSGKASKRAIGSLDITRNHSSESPLQTQGKTQLNECTESNQKSLASPDTQMTSRKRKLYRPISPVSPPLPVPIKKSPADVDVEKSVATSGSEELHRQASGHVIRYPGERLIQYAMHPPAPAGPAHQLMMMTSSRLPEMAATVGFAPSAAAMHAAMASSHAAAMMGHVISGPFPSCPCSHCVDSRPTYIVPVDFVAAATRF